MIHITGDIHGDDTITKMGFRKFPEGRTLTRDDLVIILGDFGLFWEEPMPRRDTYWLDWLEDRPWVTAFIDGNHENHEMLSVLPDKEALGSVVGCDPRWPHVWHLRRGHLYEVQDGTTLFCLGGASSHDIRWRKEGISWWPSELPSDEELSLARETLDGCGWKVDYVLTHDCPSSIKPQVLDGWLDPDDVSDRIPNDRLNDFLDEVDRKVDCRMWYFGHYHDDKAVDDRHVTLYRRILPIGETI